MIRKGYTYANDAEQIRRLAAAYPFAAEALERARAEAHDWMTSFSDDVSRRSGWGHNFCCPKCASQMTFDPHMKFAPPNVFACPHCGEKVSSVKHDEAWVYTYRYRSAAALESVAVCALLGEEAAYDYMTRFIDFYAVHYAEFPVHGDWAGKGKIQGQSLDEAVWAIAVLRGVNACGLLARVGEAKARYWYETLFAPMAELLFPQAKSIHNIPTWLLCACANIAVTFGDGALLEKALDSEFGIRNQVAKGFTKDGIWHECSMTYHYYTAEALTHFAALFAVSHPDDPLLDEFEKIYTAPLAFAPDGWHLQCVNDGWYPQALGGSAPMMLRAERIVDSVELRSLAGEFLRRIPDRLAEPAMLLILRPEEDEATSVSATPAKPAEEVMLYPDTNYAFFRTPVPAILKSGVLTRSHMHCDYCSLIVPPFSDDLGTPGYGHPLTPSWYRLGASHNVVTVDGAVPGQVLPSHVEHTASSVRAVVDTASAVPITRMERTLTPTADALLDECDYAADGEHTFDWLFHAKGDVTFSADGVPAGPLGTERGYQYFTDVRRMNVAPGERFTTSFCLNGETLTVSAEVTDGMEVWTAKSPDNPADNTRTTLVLRLRGMEAKFRVRFQIGK